MNAPAAGVLQAVQQANADLRARMRVTEEALARVTEERDALRAMLESAANRLDETLTDEQQGALQTWIRAGLSAEGGAK